VSVTTEADNRLREARRLNQGVISELSSLVAERCPGWEDFAEEVQKDLAEAFQLAMKVRDKLERTY